MYGIFVLNAERSTRLEVTALVIMYRLSHCLRTSAVISSQLSCTTRSSVLVCSSATPSCIQCQGKRTDSHPWPKTPIRTFSHHRTTGTAISLGNQSCGFCPHLPHPYHTNRQGNLSVLQNKGYSPQYTAVRLLGVSVTATESAGVYVPTPTEKCYELLEYIHDSGGLPWWLTILATTILFRGMIVFPFTVWQQMIFARIENAQPLINTYVEQIKQQLAIIAKEKGWSQRKMAKVFSTEVRMLVSNVHFRSKCSAHKLAYLPIWQMSVWLSMTTALGQMTGKHPELFSTELDIDILPALACEGVLWFSDLMQTDMALAVMLGLVNIALVELWSLRRGPLTRTQHYLHNVFRMVAIGSIPAAAVMPAAVSFYWLTSSLLGVGQLALLRIPSVRRAVNIPYALSEMKHPIEEMKAGLKARYAKRAF